MNYKRFMITLIHKLEPAVFCTKVGSSFGISSKDVPTKVVSQKMMRKSMMFKETLKPELSSYVNDANFSQLLPFLKPVSEALTSYSFVVDSTVAEDIVKRISPILNDDSIIVEGNPGLGLITLLLVKSPKDKIYLFESSTLKSYCFDQILKEFPDKLHLISSNIFTKNYLSHDAIFKLIDSVKPNLNIKIIGVVPNFSFFSQFTFRVLLEGFWEVIRFVEFYVIISFNAFNRISGILHGNAKFSAYCLFNFLFDVELIAKYPREAFLPFSKNKDDIMFLCKISRKKDIFSEICEEDLPYYFAFVRILGRHRNSYVITAMEKWLPGSGPYFISKGISVTTQVKDLSSSESIKLFNFINIHDEYKNFLLIICDFTSKSGSDCL